MSEAILGNQNLFNSGNSAIWELVFDQSGTTVSFTPNTITAMADPGIFILQISITKAYTFSNSSGTYVLTTTDMQDSRYFTYGKPSAYAVGTVYRSLFFNTTTNTPNSPKGVFLDFCSNNGQTLSTGLFFGTIILTASPNASYTASGGTMNIKCWKLKSPV